MKILVVDDDPEMVTVLVSWLRSENHEALGITGGANAASWVQREHVDLVLLDLRLRDADGLALIPDLVKTTSAKVVVISAASDDITRQSAFRDGAVAFISKPFGFDDLQETLQGFR